MFRVPFKEAVPLLAKAILVELPEPSIVVVKEPASLWVKVPLFVTEIVP